MKIGCHAAAGLCGISIDSKGLPAPDGYHPSGRPIYYATHLVNSLNNTDRQFLPAAVVIHDHVWAVNWPESIAKHSEALLYSE